MSARLREKMIELLKKHPELARVATGIELPDTIRHVPPRGLSAIAIQHDLESKVPFVIKSRHPSFPELIQAIVIDHFDNSDTAEQLKKRSRKKEMVLVRHIGWFIARTLTTWGYPTIGKKMGGYDHTSVMNGYQQIERMIQNDIDFRERVEDVMSDILAAAP